MTSRLVDPYLAAAALVPALLRDQAVASAWDAPSALAEFRVSGLAGHLAAQVFTVARLLAQPSPDGVALPVLEHYARAAWVDAPVDSEVNTVIRETGEELAAAGPDGLATEVDAALAGLRETLPREPVDRLVHLPWGPWSLSLDDFLLTRMMEVVVHADDLAVSVGVPTPDFPSAVLEDVLGLLSRLAVQRHGAPAVARALSRAERAPATITAF